MNPTCSVKDRPAFVMLESMLKSGEIAAGDTIVTASGGNFAQGVAAAAAPLGLRVIITAPANIGEKRAQLIRAYGAQVYLCDSTISPPNLPGGYQAVAKELAEKLNAEKKIYGRKCVYLDQFSDHRNSKSHHDTTGMEIAKQLNGRVGAYFGVIGTGGTIVGTGRFLKEKCKTRIIGVDVKGGIIKAR
jgi:cystathionine beta-synthase